MIGHGFHMILYRFHMIWCGFHMISYGFHMILHCFIWFHMVLFDFVCFFYDFTLFYLIVCGLHMIVYAPHAIHPSCMWFIFTHALHTMHYVSHLCPLPHVTFPQGNHTFQKHISFKFSCWSSSIESCSHGLWLRTFDFSARIRSLRITSGFWSGLALHLASASN